LDLTAAQPGWDGARAHKWFIVADDFVGSGATLLKAIRGPIKTMLEEFPTAELRIMIGVGFREALRDCMDALSAWHNRVKIIPGLLFDDRDRCFSVESRILESAEQRESMKQSCEKIAKEKFPNLWRRGFHLGWNEMAVLIVFPDTVPNDTLPIIWCRSTFWRPIFAASGIE
jgi:hypothetical protein